MDPNGLRFWLLADAAHWHPTETPRRVQFHGERRALRLVSQRTPPPWPADRAAALARLDEVREARDAFGTAARWNAERRRIVAGGALPGEVDVYAPPGGEEPTDFLLGYDGVLYLAIGGAVTLLDRRFRRTPGRVEQPGFSAWRMAPDPAGGVWVLDRDTRRVGHLRGTLHPRAPADRYDPDVVRPCDENPDPPRLRLLGEAGTAPERAVAIASSPGGRVALLSWTSTGNALLRLLGADERISGAIRLTGARYPYSLAWVGEERVAVLLPGVGEAPVFPVQAEGDAVLPVGDLYPLRDHQGGPFLHGLSLPPHFPTRRGSQPLHRVSLPSLARGGGAMNARPIDSGSVQNVWHRLYLEACIPPGCGIVIRLAATDLPAAPLRASAEWHEHRFGAVFPPGDGAVPRGAWLPDPSELPFQPGMLAAAPEPERAGLFTVLIQRAGRRVRSLRGRFLWVRAELIGNGLASPELAAVRAYGSRFSYVDQYLPELYRENVFGPDADAASPVSTPADFLERLLGTFEGVLTPLEDRIAHAHLLTHPDTAPDETLDWLASWVGLALEPAHPPPRRRAMLRAAPELARWRGTVHGLRLALDLATDGGVRGGEIVVLEEFRLRRTFATILGADLSNEDDPLVGGLAVSGNSYVGDTLFLGDEARREFLALFAADLPLTTAEEEQIADFFERLAYRVTVLVHQQVQPQDLGLIHRVVERDAPAHVETRVLAATYPFLVGLASLVGVDTYLGPGPEPRPVRVDRSRIGGGDYVVSPAALDPRLGGTVRDPLEPPPSAPPVADPGDDRAVPHGESFLLDASRSSAAPGRTLEWYRWTRMQ